MSLANPINVYVCPVCLCDTVTIDVDEGTTPFLLGCRATAGCRGMAQSSMYRPRPGHAAPAWEWYRPTAKQARKAGPAMADYAAKGGLFIRPRRVVPGPIESLMLEAWGHGVRIDSSDPEKYGAAFVDLLMRARGIDDEMGLAQRNGASHGK